MEQACLRDVLHCPFDFVLTVGGTRWVCSFKLLLVALSFAIDKDRSPFASVA